MAADKSTMLTRRKLLQYALAGSGATLLAACQPKVVEVERTVKETVMVEGKSQVVEKVVKETVVVEKAAEPAKGVKINFYHAWHRAIAGPVIEPMVRQFEEENPGIFVALTGAVPAELAPMLMASVAAGTPPSIAWGNFAPLYRAGATMPIDDYLETLGFGADQVYPYLWDMFTIKGQKYGYPVENSAVAWWYRRDTLEKVGLDEPAADWDWNDLAEFATKLYSVQGNAVQRYGMTMAMNNVWYFVTPLHQLGGSWLNENLTAPAFNSEEGLKIMTMIADWVVKDKIVPPPGAGFNANEWFVSEQTALQWDGPWRFGAWVNELELDVATVQHPKSTATGSNATYTFGGALSLMKTSTDEQNAAATFLNWFLGKENNAKWAIETGYLPIRRDSADMPSYQTFLGGKGAVMNAFLKSFENAFARAGQQIMPKFGDIQTIFVDECWDPVLLGMRTPEEGLAAAEKAIIADKTLFERIDM
jgi:multiple sugar transport system substrate-binding protein